MPPTLPYPTLTLARQRDKATAVRLLSTLLPRQGFVPTVIVTDKLRSYGATLHQIGFSGLHEQSTKSAQRFISVRAAAYNTFNVQRHLISQRIRRG
jgi:putative transposase